MKQTFLIVAALEQESRGRFENLGYPVLYTGVGKINAALALNTFLLVPHAFHSKCYKAIINLGTAASFKHNARKVLQISRFIQRDMLCEPIAPKHTTPFQNDSEYIDSVTLQQEDPGLAICGTGDSFQNFDHNPWVYNVADMEGYALAKVCKGFDIPFISLKYISDSGDAREWEASLEDASKALYEAGLKLVEELNGKNI